MLLQVKCSDREDSLGIDEVVRGKRVVLDKNEVGMNDVLQVKGREE